MNLQLYKLPCQSRKDFFSIHFDLLSFLILIENQNIILWPYYNESKTHKLYPCILLQVVTLNIIILTYFILLSISIFFYKHRSLFENYQGTIMSRIQCQPVKFFLQDLTNRTRFYEPNAAHQ